MDWERYKRLCDSPSVFSRWMLAQTLELLADACDEAGRESAAARASLMASVTRQPLPRPADHRGDSRTDMFELDLTATDARVILYRVQEAVAADSTTAATRNRGLGGFVEAWQEYLDYLDFSTTD